MFGPVYFTKNKLEKVDPTLIDQSVKRILLPLFQTGAFDGAYEDNFYKNVTSETNFVLA